MRQIDRQLSTGETSDRIAEQRAAESPSDFGAAFVRSLIDKPGFDGWRGQVAISDGAPAEMITVSVCSKPGFWGDIRVNIDVVVEIVEKLAGAYPRDNRMSAMQAAAAESGDAGLRLDGADDYMRIKMTDADVAHTPTLLLLKGYVAEGRRPEIRSHDDIYRLDCDHTARWVADKEGLTAAEAYEQIRDALAVEGIPVTELHLDRSDEVREPPAPPAILREWQVPRVVLDFLIDPEESDRRHIA